MPVANAAVQLVMARMQDMGTDEPLFAAPGANLKSVQSLLGHQSSRTTHDTYGHLLSADHRNSAVRRLDMMIGDEMGTSDPESEPR